MAASLDDNALTTLTHVKGPDLLDISSQSHDSHLRDLINQASDLFEEATNRRWYHVSDYDERTGAGRRTRKLFVEDHIPVDSGGISEIRWRPDSNTNDLIDSSDYTLRDEKAGEIFRDVGYWEDTTEVYDTIEEDAYGANVYEPYVVTYSGGYLTPQQISNNVSGSYQLPDQIERAAVEYVIYKYTQDVDDINIKSWSMKDASVEYVDGVEVPRFFARVVDQYKQPSWA